jgi:diketogulonate reductase-like aldo/keto reductase
MAPESALRRRDRLAEALGALDVALTREDLAELAKTFPPGVAAGARHPESQLVHVDSERPPLTA